MSNRLDTFFEFVRRGIVEPLTRLGGLLVAACLSLIAGAWRLRWRLAITALLTLIAYGLYTHPPFDAVRRGEVLVRTDALDGSVGVYSSGTVLVLPGIDQVRRYSIRDQVYRPIDSASATGPAPFQSVEGLSIGVDLTVRWTVDRARLAQMSRNSRTTSAPISLRLQCRESSIPPLPDTPCARSSRSGGRRYNES